jgi:3-hydroxy-9,10-secoandrosta-1,3,5(10)-triene-9,17-dione monooxygenase
MADRTANTVEAPRVKSPLTHEQAVERARTVGAAVAPFAEEAEKLRRIPPPVIEAVMESGLMPLVRPKYWGGYGLDWMAFVDCVGEIGRASGSIGWCAGFLMHHQWVLAHFPERGQAFVYGTHEDPKIVTAFAVQGRAEPVDGGYHVSGDWSFGSGGDHCDWAIVGAAVADGGPRFMLLKPGQFTMRDTWHSVGLKGTGSNNIVVEGAFVPEECTLEVGAFYSGRSPGAEFLDGPLYRTTALAQFQFGLLAPMMAIARGAHASFIEFNRNRIAGLGGVKAADDPFIQARAGESSAEIEATYATLERINRGVVAGKYQNQAEAAEVTRDFAMSARLLLQSVNRLFEVSGARGLAESNAIGRHWRDAHAITHHVALNIDGMFQGFGRHLFERAKD